MHARVWRVRLQPGKTEEFIEAVRSSTAIARRREGFRGTLALRDLDSPEPEAIVIALWETEAAMKASEQGLFVTQALSRLLGTSKALPVIHEHEVLLNELNVG